MNKRIKKKLIDRTFNNLADNFVKSYVAEKHKRKFIKYLLVQKMKSENGVTIKHRNRVIYQRLPKTPFEVGYLEA